MRVDELDYELPPERIATWPAEPRDAARLMVVHRGEERIEHRRVRDLPALGVLRSGDLMVFNQTRVLPAMFTARRAATGGRVEGLYLRSTRHGDIELWDVMLEARGSLRPGEMIELGDAASLELLEPRGGGEWRGRLRSELSTLDLLARIGSTPLPPYIRKARRGRGGEEVEAADADRYNTVYARDAGSVAAPTAGLHFTRQLLAALARAGVRQAMVTLHVGAGTFAPVRTQTLEEHAIHSEWMHVPAATLAALRETHQRGGRIVPVGTTTVRALESLPAAWAQPGVLDSGFTADTRLFITPGFAFRFTDLLVTNFHLPRSTLLALVAALPGVGVERLLRWYRAAIDGGYRFYSYGDAMLIA